MNQNEFPLEGNAELEAKALISDESLLSSTPAAIEDQPFDFRQINETTGKNKEKKFLHVSKTYTSYRLGGESMFIRNPGVTLRIGKNASPFSKIKQEQRAARRNAKSTPSNERNLREGSKFMFSHRQARRLRKLLCSVDKTI